MVKYIFDTLKGRQLPRVSQLLEEPLDFIAFVVFDFRLILLQGGKSVSAGLGAGVLHTNLL